MTVDLTILAAMTSLLMAVGAVLGVIGGYKVALHRIHVLERRVDHCSDWRDEHDKGHSTASAAIQTDITKLCKDVERLADLRKDVERVLGMQQQLLDLLHQHVNDSRQHGGGARDV